MINQEQNTLVRAKKFDLDALAAIYDRYSPGIYRYALRLIGDPDQAEECTAETFSRFLTTLKHGGGPSDNLQAYLYRIAHNWITDFYRRSPPIVELDEMLVDDFSDTVKPVEEHLQSEEVRQALRHLTPEQRQVIVLKFLEGWDNESIAQVLEKQVTAVKALQYRALESLRRVLIAEEI